MIAPFAPHIDWGELRQNKQRHIDIQNVRENTNRKFHNYEVNDKVLILEKDLTAKLNPKVLNEGPWQILAVHVNGTVTIRRNGYNEVMNIRRIRPYFS